METDILDKISKEELLRLLLSREQTEKTPISRVLDEYIVKLKSGNCREGTTRQTRLFFDEFLAFCGTQGLSHIHEVKISHIDAYFLNLRETSELKHNSIALRYAYINTAFNMAIDREYISKNPFKKAVKIKPITPPVIEWTLEDYKALIEAIPKRYHKKKEPLDKLLITLIYRNGFRIGLLLGVRRKDVDLGGVDDHPTIKAKRKFKESQGGESHDTFIVTHPEAKELLIRFVREKDREGIKPDETIFTFRRYVNITEGKIHDEWQMVYRRLQKLFKIAGRPFKSAHKGKHGFITHSMELGISDGIIMKATGNRDPKVFQRYKHARNKSLASIYEKAWKLEEVS